jgi:hypothetical protein
MTLNDSQKGWFEKNIIVQYIAKYKSTVPKTRIPKTRIPETRISETTIPETTIPKLQYIGPVKPTYNEVLDSIERFVPKNGILADKNIIKLYDNEQFRKNKPAIFNASPINITMFRNGIIFKGYYKIKQKILNILSYNGHTNIKIIDADTNSLKFTSKGKEGIYVINFNVKSYYEKYLKYKKKYLSLKSKIMINYSH